MPWALATRRRQPRGPKRLGCVFIPCPSFTGLQHPSIHLRKSMGELATNGIL